MLRAKGYPPDFLKCVAQGFMAERCANVRTSFERLCLHQPHDTRHTDGIGTQLIDVLLAGRGTDGRPRRNPNGWRWHFDNTTLVLCPPPCHAPCIAFAATMCFDSAKQLAAGAMRPRLYCELSCRQNGCCGATRTCMRERSSA